MGSRTGPFICGGVLNGLHLGLFYCCLSRGKLLCVFSLADSFLSTFIRVRASQWCSGENHQAYTGSEDRKRRNKNHNKTVTVEVNSRNLLSSFPQSWHLKWRHSQMGSHSQVLLVFFDSVSGDSVWMMMLLLLGCVDRITGNRPVCSLTDVSATAACMAFTTRAPWSEEPPDPSQRGSPGCLMALSTKPWVCWSNLEVGSSLTGSVKLLNCSYFIDFSQKSCRCQDKIFRTWSLQSWDAACHLPAGGQLSFIACRTGAALSLHRHRGWGTRYGLNPQIHSGMTALDNTTRVSVCSHLLRAYCTEQIELCKTSETGRILTHEKSGRKGDSLSKTNIRAQWRIFTQRRRFLKTQAALELFLGVWDEGVPIYT